MQIAEDLIGIIAHVNVTSGFPWNNCVETC